jgi:hypothetical protein
MTHTDPASDPLDRLLAGPDGPDLAAEERALAAALRRVRDDLDHPAAEEVVDSHVAAIATAAAAHVHTAPSPRRGSGWARRLRLATGLSVAQLGLAATVAVGATGGGLAATGNLPAPAQRAVSDAAARIGLELPRIQPAPAPRPTEIPQSTDERGPAGLPTTASPRASETPSASPAPAAATPRPGPGVTPAAPTPAPSRAPTERPGPPASSGPPATVPPPSPAPPTPRP